VKMHLMHSLRAYSASMLYLGLAIRLSQMYNSHNGSVLARGGSSRAEVSLKALCVEYPIAVTVLNI